MTGSTPPWKRRFPRGGADPGPSDGPHGVRDDERGSSAEPGPAGATGSASLEPVSGRGDPADPATGSAPGTAPRTARIHGRAGQTARDGFRKGGSRARAGLTYLADRIVAIAPRIPVRDLATLRRQFPDLGPEELADRLVAGAAKATSAVGAGVGAAAMLPVPPAMPTELAAEITGVAAIELKLIAELHEVYGLRPPGDLKARSAAYLSSWSGERGIDVMKPSSLNAAFGGPMRRRLRQQVTRRTVRNLPNLMPFMIGAAAGAVMNRRETRRLAARIRTDLRPLQVAWGELPVLPPLETPADPVTMDEIRRELGDG
ncbi:hypothetical protein [Streptomyces tropicalis]|uniref:Uncharacterized protein n=1 Tax=Streptomyces tropicalis TaxID=3034234 RepID=A0ABT6A1W1_9ACTN|nr:hypothetical protein [Streptomyces tropicalis]MDF3298371.1 hypothetical protein [Streptomyces tropicalis]